jgi:hypothetical protein
MSENFSVDVVESELLRFRAQIVRLWHTLWSSNYISWTWLKRNGNRILPKYLQLPYLLRRYRELQFCDGLFTPLGFASNQITCYGKIQNSRRYSMNSILIHSFIIRRFWYWRLEITITQSLVDKIMTNVVSQKIVLPKEFSSLMHYFIAAYNRATDEKKHHDVC